MNGMLLFYSLLLAFSLLTVYIFIKSKKYLYLPYGVLMTSTFAGFIYDLYHGTNTGYVSLVTLLIINVFESLYVLWKLVSGRIETDSSANVIVLSLFMTGLKVAIIIMVFQQFFD